MQLCEVLETCEFEAKEQKKIVTLKKKDYTKLIHKTYYFNSIFTFGSAVKETYRVNYHLAYFGTTMVAIATLNDSFRLLW